MYAGDGNNKRVGDPLRGDSKRIRFGDESPVLAWPEPLRLTCVIDGCENDSIEGSLRCLAHWCRAPSRAHDAPTEGAATVDYMTCVVQDLRSLVRAERRRVGSDDDSTECDSVEEPEMRTTAEQLAAEAHRTVRDLVIMLHSSRAATSAAMRELKAALSKRTTEVHKLKTALATLDRQACELKGALDVREREACELKAALAARERKIHELQVVTQSLRSSTSRVETGRRAARTTPRRIMPAPGRRVGRCSVSKCTETGHMAVAGERWLCLEHSLDIIIDRRIR